jgi:hypothetical protein
MMYKPDDESLEQAVEETGILEENDISEPAQETEAPQEESPEQSLQESD